MYGIDIKTLDQFITTPKTEKRSWGSFRMIADMPEFRFEQWEISAGKTAPFSTDAKREATIFVEAGELAVGVEIVHERQALILAPGRSAAPARLHSGGLRAACDTTAYIFRGPAEKQGRFKKSFGTTDFRDKYWGTIETIVSRTGYAAKRMLVKKGCAASLEYHCRKLESYFIHSGKLLLRLRAGRGEDRFFEMNAGAAALIPSGLMHQRGGKEDAVIIEISTKDEDSDSFLVEDGAKQPMLRLLTDTRCWGLQTSGVKRTCLRPKKICFDIDGVLCAQVADGEPYANAKPDKNMIALVNRLYDAGHTIYLYTARFMGRNKNDWKKAYSDGYEFTKQQVEGWGVKYHDLFFGKPNLDIIIDDRAVFYKPDFTLIEKEIRKR